MKFKVGDKVKLSAIGNEIHPNSSDLTSVIITIEDRHNGWIEVCPPLNKKWRDERYLTVQGLGEQDLELI